MSEPTKEQIEKARLLARELLWKIDARGTDGAWLAAHSDIAKAFASETAPLHEKIASLEKQLAEAHEEGRKLGRQEYALERARDPQDLSTEEIADLETGVLAGKMTPRNPPMRWQARLLAELKRRRALSSPSGDARPPVEVNEHEDLELVLFRPVSRVYRVLRCKVCQSEDTFGISLADNGQWNLECGSCYETAAILTEVLAKLR